MIGSSFATEVEAAGLMGLPFGWSSDGTISGRDNLTLQQQAALDAVIAAHDPSAPTKSMVDTERDRRLATFVFAGRAYDFDAESQTNMAGAGTLADVARCSAVHFTQPPSSSATLACP